MNQNELRMSKTTQASFSTSPSKKQQKNEKSLSKQDQDEQQQELFDFDQEPCNKNTNRFQTQQNERKIYPVNFDMRKTLLPAKSNDMKELHEMFENLNQKKNKQNNQQTDEENQYDDAAICVEEGKLINTNNELEESDSNTYEKQNEKYNQFEF